MTDAERLAIQADWFERWAREQTSRYDLETIAIDLASRGSSFQQYESCGTHDRAERIPQRDNDPSE